MKTFETILDETPAEHVARIVLNRPETRNAQGRQQSPQRAERRHRLGLALRRDRLECLVLGLTGARSVA